MLGRVLGLFIVVPLVELWLLYLIGGVIGGELALALVIGSGILGLYFARRQTQKVLRGWQEATSRGELPQADVVSGLLAMVGGILLLLPGVISDVIGIALIIPFTRRLIAGRVQEQLRRRLAKGDITTMISQGGIVSGFGGSGFGGGTPFGAPPSGMAQQGDVIDVEARETEPTSADSEAPTAEHTGRRQLPSG